MDMALEAMKMLFRKIGADKAYYRKVFEVEGQNSFEEMLYQRIYDVARQLIEKNPLKEEEDAPIISEEIFLRFQSITLVNGIKYWLLYETDEISADTALKFYEFLMSHSLLEIIDDDILGRVIN